MEVQGAERTSPEPQREDASPAPGTTAEEAMSRGPPPAPEGGSRDEQDGASADAEPWAAAVPPVSGRMVSSGFKSCKLWELCQILSSPGMGPYYPAGHSEPAEGETSAAPE